MPIILKYREDDSGDVSLDNDVSTEIEAKSKLFRVALDFLKLTDPEVTEEVLIERSLRRPTSPSDEVKSSVGAKEESKTSDFGYNPPLITATNGQYLSHFRGFGKSSFDIYSLVFSPAGDLLLVAGDSASFELWSVTDGKRLAKLDGHGERIDRVAFDSSGTKFATGGADAVVKVWKVEKMRLCVLQGHDDDITGLLSADGRFLASCSSDASIKTWTLDDGALVRSIPIDGSVNC